MAQHSSISRDWWNRFLDGNVYRLTLDNIPADVNSTTFRQRVYREANIRRKSAQTYHPRWEEWFFYQAVPMRDRYLFANLRDPNLVYIDMPSPAVFDKELADFELLGPCTCGQAPRCLPSCARVN
jgi:hypothetical protein